MINRRQFVKLLLGVLFVPCFLFGQTTFHYYIAPWEWNEKSPGGAAWQAPRSDIVSSNLDLRTIPEQATRITRLGYGFFAYPQTVIIFDGLYLGDNLNSRLSVGILSELNTKFKTTFAANTALDFLWELLTLKADVSGLTRPRPLMPTVDGDIELHLRNHSIIRSEKFDPVKHPKVLELERENYRKVRSETLRFRTDKTFHRKYLQRLAEKYKLDWRQFIPDDLPQESPLPRGTTITESFNTADSTTLGPDLTWTEVSGDFDVVSNEVHLITGGGGAEGKKARAESDLSSDDHYAQVNITNIGSGADAYGWAGAARFAAAASTFYVYFVFQDGDTGTLRKVVTDTATNLASTAITLSIPELYKIQADGSTIKGFQAGVERESETDTAITGNTRTGIYGFSAETAVPPVADDFEAADLAAAARRIMSL